jgi:uncharacterized metal-binding protein
MLLRFLLAYAMMRLARRMGGENMPGFWGHTAGNTLVFAGTTVVMASQHWSVADIAAADTGILIANFILSPDMDLFNSRSMSDWGLMRLFWWPYAKLVKHRDMMHFPILGTAVRWLYMIAVLVLVIIPIAILFRNIGFSLSFDGEVSIIFWYLGYLADMLLGAALADTMHYVLDVTTTRIKRLLPAHYHERYNGYVQNHADHHHREPWSNRQESM